jgi:hypothetical protein
MILGTQQRFAIGEAGAHPVPIIDPETHQTYLTSDLQLRSMPIPVPVSGRDGKDKYKG